MQIKQMLIEGVEGDVEIRRSERGAIVIAHDVEIEVDRETTRDERFNVAYNAAKVVYGTTPGDRPKATNSMICEVFEEIERVAGC